MKKSAKTALLILSLASLLGIAGSHPRSSLFKNPNTATTSAHGTAYSINPRSNSTFIQQAYQKITQAGAKLSEELFTLAFIGFEKLNAQGRLSQDSILTIIDFSKSSREKRMFVVDLKAQQLLYCTVVAHGRNSGGEYARAFSNTVSSHQSSLGFYITGDPYNGSNGYSLALEGIEKGFNDKARERTIVIHGAAYASESMIGKKGYLGRSFGCPSLPPSVNNRVINSIKKGNCLFIYYPDQDYLKQSELLNG